jgi:signal transduction histidine kinase
MEPEATKAPTRLRAALAIAPTVCAVTCIVVGSCAVACWWLRLEAPLSILPGMPVMMANTGLMFVLDGAALLAIVRLRGEVGTRLGKALAGAASALAVLTLLQYMFSIDLGLDELVASTHWLSKAHAHAGRSSPQTSFALLCLSTSLLAFDRRGTRPRRSEVLALGALFVALAALLGYVFEAAALYGPEALLPHTGMSIPSAVCALLLSLGILAAHSETGILAVLGARDSGGIAARTMLAWLLAMAPIIALIELGVRFDLYDAALATAFIVLFGLAGGCAIVFYLAVHLSQLDAKRRASEEARRELERLRDEWAAVVAHDLRQPVSTVSLAAQSLVRFHVQMPENEARAVARIRTATGRLNRMINDLTDASLIDSNRLAIDCEDVDVGAMTCTLVESMRELTAGHDVRTRIAPDTHAWVDADRIHQVMTNLISNAVKYGAPDTEIEIAAARRNGSVEFTVKNHGPGISRDNLESLFTKFARTSAAKQSRRAGLGLGLYIAKGLVEAHGGKLWAESSVGDTTAFHFTVPAAPRL